jgi:hypothetical protein
MKEGVATRLTTGEAMRKLPMQRAGEFWRWR